MMDATKGTRPFAPFEWMIAFRYLRARRKTSFVSVIALFSVLGDRPRCCDADRCHVGDEWFS